MSQSGIRTAPFVVAARQHALTTAPGFSRVGLALKRLAAAGVLAAVFGAAPPVLALTDHLTVVTTNPHTGAPATLELDRYSLRAPNWEARIYSSPTTYTVLPANQVPEVTTYRGRVAEDGGMVYGGVRPNGTLYAKVNYGCRDSTLPIFSDPYESSNRYSWVIWSLQLTGQTVNTGYVYAPAANEPVTAPAPPANWFNNLGATQNFGGPPPYNNMVTMPLNRVRLLCSANQSALGTYGNSIAYALIGMESAVNQADYVAARDGGVSYQIQASGVQTYAAGAVDTSADWSNMAGKFDIMCWTANWGVSGGSWVINYAEDMRGGTMVHELGHSLGGPDFCGELDYQGNMLNTEHGNGGDEMNGVDLYRCLASRANQGYLKNAGYVYYRTPVPTRANPDFASTNANTPVSVDVLLNDWNANTTSRADLSIVSFQNPSERGGTVSNLGGGVLRYTPPAGFCGDDLFRYYVSDPAGRFKSLAGVRVLVVDPNNPLIARYPFDETTGVSALDTSGGGRKGTLTGDGSFATDRVPGVGGVGGAIHFSGFVSTWDGSPRLTFGNPNPWPGDPPPDRIASYSYDAMDRSQSVSFWYRPDVLPVAGQFHLLYGKHNIYQSGFGDGGGIVLGISNNKLFAVVQMYGPHGAPVTVDSGITPQPGMWHHLVGGIDRENQQVHLYVNGVKYSSAAGVLPAGQFVIGSNSATLGGQLSEGHTMYAAPAGAYDDLRIYTKALTSTEVAALYAEPGILPASGPTPADHAIGIDLGPLLSWVPGRPGYQFDVYFGTDAAQVAAAGTGTPGIFRGRTSTAQSQVPVILDPTRTYFWRVDAVDGTTIGPGEVWQFTTGLPSPAKEILGFTWNGRAALIDQSAHTVALTVPFGTNVTALTPTITLSRFATVAPASGVSRNFTSPVPYTVTAQDGSTRTYTATIHQGAQPGTVMSLPPDLSPGAQYRLVFVTGGTAPATNTDINYYNGFVTTAATGVPALNALGTTWKAVVATAAVDVRTNTLTGAADASVPIYRLDGVRVANDNADLWDASIGYAISITEAGANRDAKVWTGVGETFGNEYRLGPGGWCYYGRSTGTAKTPYPSRVGGTGWTANLDETAAALLSFYAISGILTVPASPASCDMLSFQWGTSIGVITSTNISLTVPHGTDVTALNPTCTVAAGATVSPASGSTRNFSSPVPYTVTSQNGSAAKTYQVTVTQAAPVPHTLTVNNGSGSGSYVNGAVVTLAANAPPPGLVFDKWVINAGSPAITNPNTAGTTLTMGAGDATVTATYKAAPNRIVTVPPGLNVGDKYRLVFVTSTTRDASSSNIADYNGFVTTAATAVPALNALGTTWTAIGTTLTVNANANTLTRAGDPSAPIYRLDGARVATGNTDLWDGTIANAISINDQGNTVDVFVWTGTIGQGTKWGGHPLGDAPGWVIHGDSLGTVSTLTDRDVYGHGWVGNVGNAGGGNNSNPLYAISGILTVPVPLNTYTNWAAANAGGRAANLDSNRNGVPNGVEYFMGATPGNPAVLPPLVNTVGSWTWTIPYDPAALATYKFQVSDDLSAWQDVLPGDPSITVLTSPDRLRLTLAGPAAKKFCRLLVTTP
jgi:hypothetical protein